MRLSNTLTQHCSCVSCRARGCSRDTPPPRYATAALRRRSATPPQRYATAATVPHRYGVAAAKLRRDHRHAPGEYSRVRTTPGRRRLGNREDRGSRPYNAREDTTAARNDRLCRATLRRHAADHARREKEFASVILQTAPREALFIHNNCNTFHSRRVPVLLASAARRQVPERRRLVEHAIAAIVVNVL